MKFWLGLVAVFAGIFCGACGYIASPLPPSLHLPNRVVDLSAVQRGGKIIAQFTLSKFSTEGLALQETPAVHLYIGPSAMRFDQAVWERTARDIQDQNGKHSFEIPAQEYAGKDVVLAVRLKNENGHDAGWSNFVALSVTSPLGRPENLHAEASAQGVRLQWTGTSPLYRVYRKSDIGDFAPLGDTKESAYSDTTAIYGKAYTYFVQGLQKSGESFSESDVSEYQSITPIDKFPPSVPANLKALAGTKSIELSWDRSTESDLAGYRVYRAEGDGAFTLLLDKVSAPNYSDRTVKPGVRYRYQVAAFDQVGNASEPSSPAEAVLPN